MAAAERKEQWASALALGVDSVAATAVRDRFNSRFEFLDTPRVRDNSSDIALGL